MRLPVSLPPAAPVSDTSNPPSATLAGVCCVIADQRLRGGDCNATLQLPQIRFKLGLPQTFTSSQTGQVYFIRFERLSSSSPSLPSSPSPPIRSVNSPHAIRNPSDASASKATAKAPPSIM